MEFKIYVIKEHESQRSHVTKSRTSTLTRTFSSHIFSIFGVSVISPCRGIQYSEGK